MKDWKTTLFGACTALGLWAKDQPGWVGIAGQVITVVAPVALGLVAKDGGAAP